MLQSVNYCLKNHLRNILLIIFVMMMALNYANAANQIISSGAFEAESTGGSSVTSNTNSFQDQTSRQSSAPDGKESIDVIPPIVQKSGTPAVQNNISKNTSSVLRENGQKSDVGNDVIGKTANVTSGAATGIPNTEFQNFVRIATGKNLSLFGYELFESGSFGPVQAFTVPSGYILGPGDEIVLQVYGLLDISDRFIIDRDGRIFLPKVGPLTLSGVAFADLEKTITTHLAKVYKNFQLSVSMGRLRSIEIFVVGQARHPGRQVVSSLSTLVNALFETGGPSSNGTMRAVELRRSGKIISRLDLYQFLAKGDKPADAPLLSGDVIFIPPAGPRVALLGAVNIPAVYELKTGESIADILSLSGGLPTLASPHRVQLDRVNSKEKIARSVQNFDLDAQGLSHLLNDADMLTVFPISHQIGDVVTFQGNGISPIRTAFRSGMRVSDLLGGLSTLIPPTYWLQLNQGAVSTSYSRSEVNLHYATIQRLDTEKMRTRLFAVNLAKALMKDPTEDLILQSGDVLTIYKSGDAGADAQDSVYITGSAIGGAQRFAWRPGLKVRDIIPNAQWIIDYYNYWQQSAGKNSRDQINWDYAQIIRRLPETLSSEALSFNLGNAVLREDSVNNLLLQPGDRISIYTTSELAVPVAKRIRMVTLGGEVMIPGIYQALPGETLPQIIIRAGGFTSDAYIYGLEFKRETVRQTQQENLDRLIKQFEKQIEADSNKRLQNVASTDRLDQAAMLQAGIQADQSRLANLRKIRASGRVALNLKTTNLKLDALPRLALEDGDVIYVPTVPAFVGAFGAVHNENAILWRPGMNVGEVIDQAGLTNYSDSSSLFVMRADGTVLGGTGSGMLSSLFSSNSSLVLMPGDTVVVPESSDRETAYSAFVRGAKDWTAILAQFGLGAAAFRSLGY
jgi:protein involved in polysaccharide export with SLBB domain